MTKEPNSLELSFKNSFNPMESRQYTANPQTNAILERTHQVIANQLQSLCLMSIELNSLADIQHELLAPVHWAMNSTYHTTLQATSVQLAFHRDMVMPTSFMAHWHSIRQ
jgi:hypothetical protein